MDNYFNIKKILLFVITFAVCYGLFIFLGINIFGQLSEIEELVIKEVIGDSAGTDYFVFVVYCSGIVTISAYLAMLFSLIACKFIKKIRLHWFAISLISILIINIFRIITIIYAGTLAIWLAEIVHIVSWFYMGALAIYLLIKTIAK